MHYALAPRTLFFSHYFYTGLRIATGVVGLTFLTYAVADLPTALYIAAAELDNGVVVGQLPDSTGGDAFGLVLDLGSPLTAPVTAAVDSLREDGTLAELEAQWLTDAAGAPVLK